MSVAEPRVIIASEWLYIWTNASRFPDKIDTERQFVFRVGRHGPILQIARSRRLRVGYIITR